MGISSVQPRQTKIEVKINIRAETGTAPKAVITISRAGVTNNGNMEMAMTIGTSITTIKIKGRGVKAMKTSTTCIRKSGGWWSPNSRSLMGVLV